MMVGGGESSHSRRKSLDAEINLVPFIDLLSMCICFLLMTAVWVQIGSVQIKQSKGTEAAATSNAYEMDVKFLDKASVEVTLKKSGKAVNKFSVQAQALDSKIKSLLASLGGGGSLISAAMVTPKEGVNYGELVDVLDVLRKNQIINLGVHPAGGR